MPGVSSMNGAYTCRADRYQNTFWNMYMYNTRSIVIVMQNIQMYLCNSDPMKRFMSIFSNITK